MRTKLENVIAESGIWDGTQRDTHGFLLSPSVYTINRRQEAELSRLGYALYDCLLGLSQMAIIAFDAEANYGGSWKTARKVFSTGVPRMYQELQGFRLRDIPMLLKLDLMVNEQGEFRIAEIDGHNKHGLGYSTLAKRLRSAIAPGASTLPGAVALLAEHIRSKGTDALTLFYADQERFYLPEFQIAAAEFAVHGIACKIVSEMDANESDFREGIFLDLPFLYHNVQLYAGIVRNYKDRNISFIIPPKPFLGAKGVLALLRNDVGDAQLESILCSFIRKQSLDLVRSYIPATFLVGLQGLTKAQALDLVSERRYVLKESISSGMKGTVFSDAPDFHSTLESATRSNLNWVLQEEVLNQPQAFKWYEGTNEQESANWYMRVTTQYVNRKLGDVIVTARRDKAVHGAKDCLQLGTIVQD